jgi:carboxypeptidase D
MEEKIPTLLIAFLLITPCANASTYHEIIVHHISRQQIVQLSQDGFIIDHVKQNSATIYLTNEQMPVLDRMGLHYRVVSKKRYQKDSDSYPTVDQINKTLQTFATKYPDICQLYDIGKSYEGRPLYFIKISDHVAIEEDEPEVKYIASMHGDEPIGAMLCLNLIDDLLKNYSNNSFITQLVDSLEIWIMPLMNPDGYVHLQRMNMENKDLNRNFPDRVRDSKNTTNDRPIEIQHVMNWEFAHSSVLSANFHSGELVVNYPYDSDFNSHVNYSATPDDSLFREMALSYANLSPDMQNSPFENGITNGVEWYFVYGGMQDWSYVWMGCMEITIELCQTKWPVYSEISQLWDSNKDAMLNYFTWAQKGIRGMITDSVTGEPVYASIQVENNEFRVYTDPDVGDYHRILLPGKYNLIISAEGYTTQYLNQIAVTDSYATRKNLQLMPVFDLSLSDTILMLKSLSRLSDQTIVEYVDINRNGQLELSDIIWALNLIAHAGN